MEDLASLPEYTVIMVRRVANDDEEAFIKVVDHISSDWFPATSECFITEADMPEYFHSWRVLSKPGSQE